MAMRPRKKMRKGGMVKKMRGGGMVKKMRGGGMVKKAGPKGYTKKAGSKTTRPLGMALSEKAKSQTSMMKDKLDAMSSEERKNIIIQMLQGKTPRSMQPFVKKK